MAGNLPQLPNPASGQSGNEEKANWLTPFHPFGFQAFVVNGLAKKQLCTITSLVFISQAHIDSDFLTEQ
jgi:hypothetical protein